MRTIGLLYQGIKLLWFFQRISELACEVLQLRNFAPFAKLSCSAAVYFKSFIHSNSEVLAVETELRDFSLRNVLKWKPALTLLNVCIWAVFIAATCNAVLGDAIAELLYAVSKIPPPPSPSLPGLNKAIPVRWLYIKTMILANLFLGIPLDNLPVLSSWRSCAHPLPLFGFHCCWKRNDQQCKVSKNSQWIGFYWVAQNIVT